MEKILIKKPSIFTNALLLIFSLMIASVTAEFLVRKAGFRPWNPGQDRIQIEPGGKLAVKHPVLGYALIPGRFKLTLSNSYTFSMTHLTNGLRITHAMESYTGGRPNKEIWIFGCSFTYGWSLNDNETYPWKLQEQLPDYEVINFGAIGYDTLNAHIQFQDALKEGKKPEIAIYAYASFHDERNTFLRKRRKTVGPANQLGPMNQPYARMNRNGVLEIKNTDTNYQGLPFVRYSALINLIDNKLNDQEDRFVNSREVTKQLIEQFAQTAKKNNVTFIIAGIDSDSSLMLQELKRAGLRTVDISVNLDGNKNRNWPYDSHPNAKANQQYAKNLFQYLKSNGFV